MEQITTETHIDQMLAEYPSLSKVFIELGLPCLVCGEPFWGTVNQLCAQHGKDAAILVKLLNEEINESNEKT